MSQTQIQNQNQQYIDLQDQENLEEGSKSLPYNSQEFQQVYTKDNEMRQSFYKINDLPTQPTERQSQVLKCPNCNIVIRSQLEYKGDMATLVLSGFLLLSTGILAPLPFMINKTRNCIHKCPKCNMTLGKLEWIDKKN